MVIKRARKSAEKGETRIEASPTAPHAPEGCREELLCVAKKLFAQKGFAGTSIKALTDLAKVNISLVSYHFGGKKGLYQACIANLFNRKSGTPDRMLSPPSSAVEFRLRFTLFLEEMLEQYADDPDAFRIIYQDLEGDEELGDEITQRLFSVYENHVAFLKAAKEEGLLASEIDPEAASTILFGITNNLMRSDHLRQKYLGKTIQDPEHRKHMAQQIIQIFFEGITPSHSRGHA